jgi:hypothetical protein
MDFGTKLEEANARRTALVTSRAAIVLGGSSRPHRRIFRVRRSLILEERATETDCASTRLKNGDRKEEKIQNGKNARKKRGAAAKGSTRGGPILRTVSPEPLPVNLLVERSERDLPRFLLVVGQTPESCWVHPELATHLDLDFDEGGFCLVV